ncbi:serine/threonine protein kinase KIN1/2 [Nematocida minor]|uniref:serine/threonine protein kinase KIN1/2 n=1 Tax=Nematocida minor TaxID=1912983 RepID=UPI00221E65A8|nr:serine/threonine protein kinase KIN1/2 [Nematocida minor]KAI5191854.1 serine/threonine protein kinase KIN1/2 [Nematocida minor]
MNRTSELKYEPKMNNYVLKEVIETGTTSYVYKGVDIRTNETVAIKVISRKKYIGIEKKQARENRILREALISFLLSHRNILQLREFFYTNECFYLVFDYIAGEQLLKKVVKHRKLSENVAKKYFTQILNAVNYCHLHSIVHRDIKIENILIDKDDNAVLIDFGLANFYEKEGFLGTFCGSLYFAAPELLSGNLYKGPEVDVWSLGVVLYVMVCGKVPFDDKNLQSLYHKIISGAILTDGISNDLKSLLMQMLNPNRSTRISISEIYKHPWLFGFEEKDEPKIEEISGAMDPNVSAYLNYLFGGQFKKKDGSYYNSIKKLYLLFKGKQKGRLLSNRLDGIVDFVSDKKMKVKNSLIRHWRGIKSTENILVGALEEIIREMGLTFEVAAGRYLCTLDNDTFMVQLSKNVFNKAYGLDIKSTSKNENVKTIKKLMRSRLRQLLQPDKLVLINNAESVLPK